MGITRRDVGVGLSVAVLAIAIGGCAELAAIAPAVSVDAIAARRAAMSTTIEASDGWSWGLGVGLTGTLDAGAIAVAREPRVRGPAMLEPLPCRVPELCAWEARARARALQRAREVAMTERAR